MTVKLVTGFVDDITVRHRTVAEYRALGARLMNMDSRIAAYEDWKLADCWLYKFLKTRPPVTSSDGGDPAKNTLDYLIVQHQKVEWMLRAAMQDPYPEVFVWVDYGVFHMPSVREFIIRSFMARVRYEFKVTIPGCWPLGQDGGPCWRFCGSVLICPRRWLLQLDTAIKATAVEYITGTNNVTWEVNTWADVERKKMVPIKWYQADHDASLFSNYEA